MSIFQKCRESAAGFALVTVLVMIALLSLLTFDFSHRSRINLKLAINYAQAKKAENSAYGGYQIALSLLMHDTNGWDGPGDSWYNQLPLIPIGKGVVSLRIEDEKARFNLRKLVTSYGFEDKRRSAMLSRGFEALSIDPSLVNAIVDWEDSDDIPHPGGAERSSYMILSTPYTVSNRPFDTIGELLLVRGITRKIYFLPPHERDSTKDENLLPLKDYCTVYGDGKINVNTAGIPVLRTLSEDLTDTIARDIVAFRDLHPFKSITDIKNVETVSDVLYDEISDLITVKSSIYRITSSADVDGIRERITAVVMRQSRGFRVVYFNRSL